MADVKQMVAGFNHNIKHRGKPYHIQTEDSGLGNPRIITHLFVGGNILASKKTSYADIVGAENLSQVVRELMEEQHKEMLRNLINGVYDDDDAALAARARAYQPGQLAPDLPRPPEPMRAPAPAVARPPQPAMPPRASSPAPPPRAASPAPPPRAASPASPPRAASPASPPRAASPASPPAASPASPPHAVPPRSAVRPNAGAPPMAPPRQVRTAQLGPLPQPPPAKPAPGDTLFGEDLISEKSLDEVILSYLAEDLGARKP